VKSANRPSADPADLSPSVARSSVISPVTPGALLAQIYVANIASWNCFNLLGRRANEVFRAANPDGIYRNDNCLS